MRLVALWGATALWSSDPAQEARRLDERDPPAIAAAAPPALAIEACPRVVPSRPAGKSVRVALAEAKQTLEVELRGVWGAPDGQKLAGRLDARLVAGVLAVSSGAWSQSASSVVLSPLQGSFCLGAKCYRGSLELQKLGSGIALINRLDIEEYLLGVVPGEIGRKLDWHFLEAAKAQAIVARTYTLRSLGQYGGKPWDVRDDVRDQVYDGMKGEDSMCSRAVRATRGQILVDGSGKAIDAYYHSTSGGHTADIGEVWPQKAPQAYLRGVVDTAPDGRSWGGAAPVSEWAERWPLKTLHDSVRRDLTEALGRKVDPGKVQSLRLEGRDSSGRAKKLVVTAENGTYEICGDRIRWALRRTAKGRPILRSTRFELEIVNGEYLAEGTGYGHGVGMSQNGAMGRAFVGQQAEQILTAYYPGTVLRTLEP